VAFPGLIRPSQNIETTKTNNQVEAAKMPVEVLDPKSDGGAKNQAIASDDDTAVEDDVGSEDDVRCEDGVGAGEGIGSEDDGATVSSLLPKPPSFAEPREIDKVLCSTTGSPDAGHKMSISAPTLTILLASLVNQTRPS
jgi:hypothetical protein